MAFYPLANLLDLHDGYMKPVKVEGRSMVLIQEQGKTFLIEDRCPHMDAPLYTGSVAAGAITCRVHGIAFDLMSGKAKGPLSGTLDCLKFFELAYDGNKVGVEI